MLIYLTNFVKCDILYMMDWQKYRCLEFVGYGPLFDANTDYDDICVEGRDVNSRCTQF